MSMVNEKKNSSKITGWQLSVCWIDSVDTLLVLILGGIFQEFRDYQFPSLGHPFLGERGPNDVTG